MEITISLMTLILAVFFQGERVFCTADSGSGMTIVRQSVANRIPDLGAPTSTVGVVGVGGAHIEGRVYRVKNIGTRYMGWTNERIAVFPDDRLSVDCLLGADLMGQKGALVLDWQIQEIYPSTDGPR